MTVKKALITGITGMVGSHLCDYLFDNTDWDIHGLVDGGALLKILKDIYI